MASTGTVRPQWAAGCQVTLGKWGPRKRNHERPFWPQCPPWTGAVFPEAVPAVERRHRPQAGAGDLLNKTSATPLTLTQRFLPSGGHEGSGAHRWSLRWPRGPSTEVPLPPPLPATPRLLQPCGSAAQPPSGQEKEGKLSHEDSLVTVLLLGHHPAFFTALACSLSHATRVDSSSPHETRTCGH